MGFDIFLHLKKGDWVKYKGKKAVFYDYCVDHSFCYIFLDDNVLEHVSTWRIKKI